MNFLAPLVAVAATTLSSPLSKIELDMVALTPKQVETKLDSIILFTPTDKEGIPISFEFDVDGIIEGYNSHSLIFKDIKHNDREVYTGYFTDGSVETFHDFNWSATSIITGKEYNYPCHCRWVWDGDKIASTTCYVDPAAIFEEAAIYAESQN